MFQSLFSLSLHYHRLISINCRYFFSLLFYFYYRFSYTQIWYYLISDTVLNWHFNDLKQNSCPRLFTFCCRCCHSFHFLFFQTLTLNSFSFSYYQSTILMSIYKTNFIVVVILICLEVCWKWIDNSIRNRHRFNPSIMHSQDINKSKWLKERMIICIQYLCSKMPVC